MHTLQLYDNYTEALFVRRESRFTVSLLRNKKICKAYLPNTGRLTEYCSKNTPFYIVKRTTQRFLYRAVSSLYQNSYVLLDTLKTNELIASLLTQNRLPALKNIRTLKREYPYRNVRFDLYLTDSNKVNHVVEVKTCTLCHNGIALFPDAPSRRAYHHIEMLSQLHTEGFTSWMIFLIPTVNARMFIPNLHTDPLFAAAMREHPEVNFRAYRIRLSNPVTVDLDTIQPIPINYEILQENLTPAGSYVCVLANHTSQTITIGSLGPLFFQKGYYVYIGSALNNLAARIKRHRHKKKTSFWHIDYLIPTYMEIVHIYQIRRNKRIEQEIGRCITSFADTSMRGFGASDSPLSSHLFYFKGSPLYNRSFISCILDFKTFTEESGSILL